MILPGTTFILGDTDAEAHEIADEVRRAQVSGPHAIMFLEQLWNRDLSAYDPDGPLPEVDPDLTSKVRAEGSAQARTLQREAVETAARWRARAEADNLSIRELVIEMTGRQSFIGSPQTVADGDRRPRPGRRVRRLHPDPARHPGRAGPIRRRGRAAAAGTRRVPDRVRGPDAP